MASNLDRLNAIKTLCLQLILQVQLTLASPTQANIDAAVAAVNNASATNPLVPKPTYGLDGESYNWESYQSTLIGLIEKLNLLIQMEAPFAVNFRAVT